MTNRQRFIIDMVEKYKKDYPKEYSNFLDVVEYRRAMSDKKLGKLKGVNEIRNAATIPDKLFNLLAYVFNGVDESKFLESKEEMKWFIKKFPEFLIPKSY